MTLQPPSPAVSTLSLPDDATHVHRWRIDEQGGASSAGHCSCGVARDFQNGWDGDSGFQLSSGNWLRRRGPEKAAAR